jgi:hypothetical protein
MVGRVRWDQVAHAYGPAGDVPALLDRLRSPDAAARDAALDDLWSRLCHQGTVYPASAAAVPALADLAVDASVPAPVRVHLVHLVAHIGRGEDTTWEGYQPLEVALDARRAVAGAVPRLVAAAPRQDGGWRRACLALCAQLDDCLATVEPGALVDDADDPVARVAAALRDGADLDAVAAAAAEGDEDLEEYVHEVLADLPPERRARALLLELAAR